MEVICVVNMKGGVAKTTLATNLAHALWLRKKKRVLLVDLDPQFNATQCLFSGPEYVKLREKGAHTVMNVFEENPAPLITLAGGAKPVKPVALKDIKPTAYADGFDVLLGDLELYRLEMAAGQGREKRLKRFLTLPATIAAYDYVLIDTPPTPSVWMMSALLASDYYLVPVKPEPLSAVGIDLLQGVINRCTENHGHDIQCLGVVLTIAEMHHLAYKNAVAFLDKNKVWAGRRFKTALPKRTGIARGQGHQELILESTVVDAKLALSKITDEFLSRLGGT